MFNGSRVKLVDVQVRDAQGKPTGKLAARPTYVPMVDPAVYYDNEEALKQYINLDYMSFDAEGRPFLDPAKPAPDDGWYGQETIYLKFNTKAQAEALLKAHLAQ